MKIRINIILYIIYDSHNKTYLSELNPESHNTYPGLTTFPGGKVNKNESLKNALIRELKEELNIVPLEYTQLGEPLTGKNEEILLLPFPY